MKKACSVLLSVLLIFTMQLCVFAEAGEIGKTQLKTVVPNTHEITAWISRLEERHTTCSADGRLQSLVL